MRLIVLSVFLLLSPLTLAAWELIEDKFDNGDPMIFAEQIGEGGAFLSLVCAGGVTHVEVIFPGPIEEGDGTLVLQVDSKPERLLAGFFEAIDADTTVFVGLDRRDRPAAATTALIKQMKAGSYLYIGDPDLSEAIEAFSMKGSSAAIRDLNSRCPA